MPELELDTVMEERDDDDEDDSSELRSAVATLERQHEQSGQGGAALLRTRAEVNDERAPSAVVPVIVLHEASPADSASQWSNGECSSQDASACEATVTSVMCFGLDMLSRNAALAAVASAS